MTEFKYPFCQKKEDQCTLEPIFIIDMEGESKLPTRSFSRSRSRSPSIGRRSFSPRAKDRSPPARYHYRRSRSPRSHSPRRSRFSSRSRSRSPYHYRSRSPPRRRRGSRSRSRSPRIPQRECRVYVGNLPYEARRRDLWDLMSEGTVYWNFSNLIFIVLLTY